MNHEKTIRVVLDPEDVATFCMNKLASLEASFTILCHRATKAGIECSDLHVPVTEANTDGEAN